MVSFANGSLGTRSSVGGPLVEPLQRPGEGVGQLDRRQVVGAERVGREVGERVEVLELVLYQRSVVGSFTPARTSSLTWVRNAVNQVLDLEHRPRFHIRALHSRVEAQGR
jgi:hypothetical protein